MISKDFPQRVSINAQGCFGNVVTLARSDLSRDGLLMPRCILGFNDKPLGSQMNASSSKSLFPIRKLPTRYAAVVMPLILSCFMTCIVSLISTLRSIGWAEDVVNIWMGSWAISWLIAFPALLLMLPVARRLTSWIVRKTP